LDVRKNRTMLEKRTQHGQVQVLALEREGELLHRRRLGRDPAARQLDPFSPVRSLRAGLSRSRPQPEGLAQRRHRQVEAGHECVVAERNSHPRKSLWNLYSFYIKYDFP